MTREKIIRIAFIFLFGQIAFINFTGCAVNLLPKNLKEDISLDSKNKAKALLDQAKEAQGFQHLEEKNGFSVVAVDTWRGFLGSMGKLWPNKKTKLEMNFSLKKFDGNVKYLDGKKEGFTAAMVGEKYWVKASTGKYEKQKKPNKKVKFGIEAYHWFFEIANGISRAEIMGYVGEEEYNGKKYDIVFATWKTKEPNKRFDQYLIWINKDTHLIERATYTIRENYLPGPSVYGNIVYSDFREVDGFKVPFIQTVFAFDVKKNMKKFVHQFIIEKFEFKDFEGLGLSKN